MEELFALGAPAEERERFAAALVAAADGAGGRVRVVLCLRDDFLARAEALGPLRGRLASALTVLVTPAPAELRRIVLEPAERAGYWFEDEAVVDEMVAAIADRPGGLALLSFAALAWWERRDRERHLLPTAAYRRLGGVAGALASHADALYSGMPASAQRAARDIIRQLVTAEGTRAALPAADLVRLAGPGGEQALDGLIAGRLLVARDDVDGDAVELAHESLIEVWPLLRRIREEDAADAGLRDDLRAAARGWSQRRRGDDELWRGSALAELERFRARAGVRLTSLEEEFADASRAIGRRTRRRRRALVFAAIGAAAAAAVVLGLAERDARRSEARARTLAEKARRGEEEAEIRLARTWAIEGQRESARGSPLRALAYLLPAYGRVDGSGTRFAIARAMASIDEERAVLRGHRSSIHSIEWSHDGRMLATVDEEAVTRLWRFDRGRVDPVDIGDGRGMFLGFSAGDKIFGLGDVKDGSIVLRTVAGQKEVARIKGLASKETQLDGHFSDSGGSLLLFRSDGVVWFYGADGALRRRAATGLKIDFAAADRSGRRVFLAGETGGLFMWDMRRGKRRQLLPVSFGGLAMSDRGDVVVAGGADGNTYVIDGAKGVQRHVMASHPGRHYTAVSRDGRWIATGGYDRTAKLWRAATGKLVATLHEHRGPVSVVAFDPKGQLLATASGDGTVRIYNTRGAMLAAYEGHTADILDLAWSPDGQWLASGAADGLVAVWPGRSPQTREISGGNQELNQIEVCGDHAMLAFDKELALHDIASGKVVRRIPLDEPPFSVACSAGRIAVGTTDGVRLLSLDGEQLSRERGAGEPISVIGFSRDGRAMATISYDQTVRMWDGITGKPGRILVGSPEDPAHASSLDFSADGESLFVGDSTGEVTVWSTGGEMLLRRRIHNQEVIWLAVSRDGARLAAASADRSLSIAGAGVLVPERTIEEHVAFVTSIDWSADSKLLLTGSEDTSAFVWDVDTGALVGEIRPGRGAVAGAMFAGDRIVAGSRGGRAMTFPASLERRSPEEIRKLLHCRLPYRLGGAGRIERVTPPEGCR
jgi:WD40 repeat protein